MKKLIITIVIIIIFISSLDSVLAAENKFGIHILEPQDLPKAAELVNSSGGDWGYVTIVIRDDDMNFEKWQDFMDQCREKHLIPLVRIATHLENGIWVKPRIEDAQKWLEFLDRLNWPVKDQYVIIYNEPNQAKEWGGEIKPKEYAKILAEFSSKFKVPYESEGSKFRILNAGFDLAAPNSKTTMDAYKFWQEMNWEIPGIFEKIDGWVSHSYPNHGFVGKPWEKGRTSVKGYEWELWVLKNHFGLKKDLPVFITETGWPKNSSKFKVQSSKFKIALKYYDEKTVAEYLKYAFENVWLKDNKIKAVTPFLLNYPGDLFYNFSWIDKNGFPFPQYEVVKNLPKQSWWPEQEQKFDLEQIDLPPFLLTESSYKGRIPIINKGQSILGEKEEFLLKTTVFGNSLEVSNLRLTENFLKPFQKAFLEFEIKTGTESSEFKFAWEGTKEYKVKVLKPTFITKARLTFWEKILSKFKFFWHK
jgi:hypothetical protein